MSHARSLCAAVTLLLAWAAWGCAEPSRPAPSAGGAASAAAEAQVVQVYAASSLTEALSSVAQAFERSAPGVQVRLTFAGSQVLRLQIAQGAPAHVFASANRAHLAALAASGQVSAPQVFAHNALALVVPTANPSGIERFADLPKARRLVIGSRQTPVGQYTRALFARAEASLGASFALDVASQVVSEESNVRLVRAKVALGEADAAVVYRTDARGPGLRTVPVPPELNVRAAYAVALTPAAPAAAQAFVDFLHAPAGAALLRRHGFTVDPRPHEAP